MLSGHDLGNDHTSAAWVLQSTQSCTLVVTVQCCDACQAATADV